VPVMAIKGEGSPVPRRRPADAEASERIEWERDVTKRLARRKIRGIEGRRGERALRGGLDHVGAKTYR